MKVEKIAKQIKGEDQSVPVLSVDLFLALLQSGIVFQD
jgi:hypothetical protein